MSESPRSTTDGSNPNRRRILKATAAAGAAAGATGVATADRGAMVRVSDAEAEAATQQFRDIDSFRNALDGELELLEAVSDAGLADEASAEAIGVETLGDPTSESDAQTAVDVHVVDGEVTADLLVTRETDNGTLKISVKPQVDRAFALLERNGEYEELYENYCTDCGENETCTYTCVYCNGSNNCLTCNSSPNMKYNYYCECTEDCGGGGWW